MRRRVPSEPFLTSCNESANSPLAGKLSSAQSVTGKISRVTFNRAVGKVLATGVFRDTDPENRYKLLRNYFAAFDAELKDKALLTRAVFFEAICEVFDTAVQRAVAIRKNAKQESIQEIISPLTKLSYRGSGARALLDKAGIVSTMQSALSLNVGISREML